MRSCIHFILIVSWLLALGGCNDSEDALLLNTEAFVAEALINDSFSLVANYSIFGENAATEFQPAFSMLILNRVEGEFSYSSRLNPLSIDVRESLVFWLPYGISNRSDCYELVPETQEVTGTKAQLAQRSHDVFFEVWELVASEPAAQVCITDVSKSGKIIEGTFENVKLAYNDFTVEHNATFIAPEYTDTVLLTNGTFKARIAVEY